MLSNPANYAPSHLRPSSLWPRNQLRSAITEDAPVTSMCLWGGVKRREAAPREVWSVRSVEVYPYVKFFLSDDNSHLIGQLTWWAELQRKRWSYCTLSASSSLAKRFFCFFFCSTSLLCFVSKCIHESIHVLAVLQQHVLVNSVPPSSIRLFLASLSGGHEGEWGERGFFSASPSSLIIFGCSLSESLLLLFQTPHLLHLPVAGKTFKHTGCQTLDLMPGQVLGLMSSGKTGDCFLAEVSLSFLLFYLFFLARLI